MGSIAKINSGGEYIYRSSKAALNMVMRSFAHAVTTNEVTVEEDCMTAVPRVPMMILLYSLLCPLDFPRSKQNSAVQMTLA